MRNEKERREKLQDFGLTDTKTGPEEFELWEDSLNNTYICNRLPDKEQYDDSYFEDIWQLIFKSQNL